MWLAQISSTPPQAKQDVTIRCHICTWISQASAKKQTQITNDTPLPFTPKLRSKFLLNCSIISHRDLSVSHPLKKPQTNTIHPQVIVAGSCHGATETYWVA